MDRHREPSRTDRRAGLRADVLARGVTVLILAVVGILASSPTLFAQGSARGGGFAALVNGEPVTFAELDQAVLRRLAALSSRYPEEVLQGQIEKQRPAVLEELIVERLLLQRCTREKIDVRPEEVDLWVQGRIEDLRRVDDSIRDLGDFFDRWEVDFGENEEQARQNIRRQMRIRRLLDTRIYQQEYISPAELRAYYRNNPEEFSTPTVHIFRQVLIPKDEVDVKDILAAIEADRIADRDFAEMITEYSSGPRAAEGGVWELTDEQLDGWYPPVPETVRNLPVGMQSDPLFAPSNIHVIELIDHRVGRRKDFAECQLEIRARLREQREALQRERFEQSLRRNADIRVFLDTPRAPTEG